MIEAVRAVYLADALKSLPRRHRRGQPAPPGDRARPVAAGHAAAGRGGPRPRRRPGPRLRHARRRQGGGRAVLWPPPAAAHRPRRPARSRRRRRRAARRRARPDRPLRPTRARHADPPGLDRRRSAASLRARHRARSSAIVELFVIGAALLVAVGRRRGSSVAVRRPQVAVGRWIRPVGAHRRRHRPGRAPRRATAARTGRPPFELVEPVGADRTARMAVAPLPPAPRSAPATASRPTAAAC